MAAGPTRPAPWSRSVRRGDRYILKFNRPQLPEMETGAHAIVHRILWAIGYNVIALPIAAGVFAGIGLDPGEQAQDECQRDGQRV